MGSKVYRLAGTPEKLAKSLPKLWKAASLAKTIPAGGFVALKMHFGEPKNDGRTVRPACVKALVECVKRAKGRPFLTDTNVLYRGPRHFGDTHLAAALGNGYTLEGTGAPVVIADGLDGESEADVPLARPVGALNSVRLGGAIVRADAVVVLTHVTGHMLFGLGGALKNVGMGAASPGTKQWLHAVVKPRVNASKCTGCRRCERECPAGAVSFTKADKARIDLAKCVGCGECVAHCPAGAIPIDWGEGRGLQERTVEVVAALARAKPGRMAYVSFLTHVSADCDCMGGKSAPLVDDIGALASTDPVAIDQASVDLVNAAAGRGGRLPKEAKAPGGDKIRGAYPSSDWTVALDAAERIGLGSREYEMVEVG